VPLDLAAGDDRPAHRQQIFKQGRTAATKASDIDKLCQCRPSWACPWSMIRISGNWFPEKITLKQKWSAIAIRFQAKAI